MRSHVARTLKAICPYEAGKGESSLFRRSEWPVSHVSMFRSSEGRGGGLKGLFRHVSETM